MTDNENKFYVTVGENIKKYRLARNYSQEVLGEKLGLRKKAISLYEYGEIRFNMDRLRGLAKALGVTPVKLLEGTEAYMGMEPVVPGIIKLPILGSVPAGGPVMAEENIIGHIPLPEMFTKSENDFCLQIRGDSMEDVGISDGDYILVHPQPIAENGQTVIARIDGEVTCKRFYRAGDKCRLEPANHKYKPIDCDELEIIGIVTKVIKEIF